MKRIHNILFLLFLVYQYLSLYSINVYAQEWDLQSYPKRIISLAPSLTEELFLLGIDEKIVGVTTYCIRPAEAEKKQRIGNLTSIDLEKVVSLKPDLVLATSITSPKTIEKLKNLNIKVVSFTAPKTFSQLCEQFLELGKIVGKKKEAEDIINRAKIKVEHIKKKVEGLQHQRVFLQIGTKPLFAATKDYIVSDFVELAGGINITYNLKSGLYSRENVVRDNPDIIIIVTMGIAGEDERKIWRFFKSLEAIKNNRIYIVDSYKVCAPTPESFPEGLEEVIKVLYPKISRE